MDSENTEKHLNILTKAATRLKDTVSATTAAIGGLFSADSLSDFLIASFKEAVSELKEIDRLITRIGKNNRTLSKTDLAGFRNKALQTSALYGTKPAEYLEEILEASLAGYKNADEIAELSTALQITAGIGPEAARGIITAADSAYTLGGSVTELTKILNGLLTASQKGAINMEQLSESFLLASEQAAQFGSGAGETAAATATLISSAGMEAEEAAKALNSLISVISGSYQNCLAAGSISADSFADACGKLGVSLGKTSDGITSLQNPMQIINSLADACLRLSDTDPARLELLDALNESDSTGAASEALDALMRSRDEYEQLLSGYSDNTADIIGEAQSNVTSLDGALNRLSDTWTSTVSNIYDSNAATALVDTANVLLSSINGITSAIGSLGTLSLGTGLFAGIKNFGRSKMSDLTCYL